MTQYIGALDQGTTSTRFIVFDAEAREVARHQREHTQILPRPGWVEHDPLEILARAVEVIERALATPALAGKELSAIGIANQRETTVVWNPRDGRPWYNAIVWQDTRTHADLASLEPIRGLLLDRTGLPPATYFSATKLQWILDNVAGVRAAAERGEALFGTVDTWVIWNLTGGPDGGRHVTDVSNASRTQLMNLRTLDWDDDVLVWLRIPRQMLPAIHASSDSSAFGVATVRAEDRSGIPICASLGDQHAAMIGQACVRPGEAKNTYGTGNFMLLNTGTRIVASTSGLLTTVAYGLGTAKVTYALEGSVAVTGSSVQWLRDQLGIIRSADEIESLAGSVPDSAGLYFVPAFSGLFAPYWRPDARGTIAGLTRFHTKAHLARATLESICFQTREVLGAMTSDSGVHLDALKVDGGATSNNLLMQIQADILGVPVIRPVVTETTALGAAYAAGLAIGLWADLDTLRHHWKIDRSWEPGWTAERREAALHDWRKAVERSLGWVEGS